MKVFVQKFIKAKNVQKSTKNVQNQTKTYILCTPTLFRVLRVSCLKSFAAILLKIREAGAYPEISKGGGCNLKPRQLKLFLLEQAFLLVSAYAGLRLPICTFCHISPFNTLIFFTLVYLGLR